MPEIAYLNGEFMPLAEARISVEDRGYLFGDGVYEVVVSYQGRLWALERHLQRLERSLRAIRLTGVEVAEIRKRVQQAVERAEFPFALVYFHVTRGVAPRDHAYAPDLTPTVLITVRPWKRTSPEEWEQGATAITVPEIRWARRDIKSLNLLPNVLAKQRAREQGAEEALFVEPSGEVNEGSSTNVFAVKDGVIITPALGPRLLPGITRGLVVEIARQEGFSVREEALMLDVLRTAEEAFLTGTGTEILGIVAVDGQPIGEGRVGPVTRRLKRAYELRVAQGRDEP
ncbi:MAG TPA: amino acid aminotransferase [Armatimonadetes bacterium]|nr:amino acid aminotransferase [Armatimonadota bacterium]